MSQSQANNPAAQFQGIPHLDTPFVDGTGMISYPWLRLLLGTWKATGGGTVAAGQQIYLQAGNGNTVQAYSTANNDSIGTLLQPGAIPAGTGELLGGTGQAGQAQTVGLSASFSITGEPEILSLLAATAGQLGGLLQSTGGAGQFVTGLAVNGALQYGNPVYQLTQGAVTATGSLAIGAGLVLTGGGSPSLAARVTASLPLSWPTGLAVANGTNYLTLRTPYAGTVDSLDSLIATGTCTIAVAVNGTPVGGLGTVAVSGAGLTNTPAAPPLAFVAGSYITLVVSAAAGGAAGLTLGVNVTWTS